MNQVKVIQNGRVFAEYKSLRYDLITLEETPENFTVIGHEWGEPPEGEFSVVAKDIRNHNNKGYVTLERCHLKRWFSNGGDELQFSGKYKSYTWQGICPLNGPALIEKALEIAQKAHQLQLDKLGEPYILHPLRVMNSLWSPAYSFVQDERYKVMAAALLHDVLEDTKFTAKGLLQEGIPEEVVEAVRYLTHYPHISYEQYIKKVCTNPIALAVKKADICDNIRPDRLALLPEETRARLQKKYGKALKLIEENANT
jgi:hypothetical protein